MKVLVKSEDNKANEGYTIYENPDKEMVKAIKNMSVNTDIFNHLNFKNARVEQTLNDKQNLCIDDKGEYFIIDTKGISEEAMEDLLNKINKKFDVAKVLNGFGLVASDGLTKPTFSCRDSRDGYDDLFRIGSTEEGIDISTYAGLNINETSGKWGSGMFCFLNVDGNIENRDYNINLTDYIGNELLSKEELIQIVLDEVPDVDYYHYGDKWFTDKFAYVFSDVFSDDGDDGKRLISLEKYKNEDGVYRPHLRGRSLNHPVSAKLVNRKALLSKLLPQINELKLFGKPIDISQYLTDEVKSIPRKRIQYTDTSKLGITEVWDLKTDKSILSNLELMEALECVSKNIDFDKNIVYVNNYLDDYLTECELPNFSFDKGEEQEDHSDYLGLVELPFDCNYTFSVEEGDVCEISWAHSIYDTDIIGLVLLD